MRSTPVATSLPPLPLPDLSPSTLTDDEGAAMRAVMRWMAALCCHGCGALQHFQRLQRATTTAAVRVPTHLSFV